MPLQFFLLGNAAAKSLQSCPTPCDPIDSSPPGSSVPGILQARTLERVAISFSNAWKWKVKGKSLSRVRLLATPWTAAYQAPPSMGFSRQVGCHCLLRNTFPFKLHCSCNPPLYMVTLHGTGSRFQTPSTQPPKCCFLLHMHWIVLTSVRLISPHLLPVSQWLQRTIQAIEVSRG